MTDGEEIKFNFVRRKQDVNGKNRKYYLPPGKWQKDFDKAADICNELGADPTQFVDAIFHERNPDDIHAPFLHGINVKKVYTKYMEQFDYPPDKQWDHDLNTLATQLKLGRSVEWALMYDTLNFSPWFRICVTKEPNSKIIAKYKEQAREEADQRVITFLREKGLDYKRITL